MSNPFNEARQEQLKNDSIEFLKSFGIQYGKAFGLGMYEKIKAEVEGEPANEKRLSYRPFSAVKRPDMFKGMVYMKSGEGAGSFSKWKQVFVIEQQDFNIAIYGKEGDYMARKKPKELIRVAGYKLQRSNVTWHFQQQMRSLAGPMDLGDDVVTSVSFSRYAWSLTHFNRTNYIFQLHKGKDPACGCLGGGAIEPDELGAEFSGEREKWCDFMGRCTNSCSARDVSTIHGQAFDNCVKSMSISLSNLRGFKDDGTEAEILVDLLMEQVLSPMRDDILRDIKAPSMMKLPAWYKTRGVIQVVILKLVEPAWAKMAEACKTIAQKIEPPIRAGLGPIFKIKEAIKDKVKDLVADQIGKLLAKMVTPFLQPVFRVFEKPLSVSFDMTRDIYVTNIGACIDKGLPDSEGKRNNMLDQIPRHPNITSGIQKNCNQMVEPIKALTKLSQEIFGDLDPIQLKTIAEDSIFVTLDAAVYTFQCRVTVKGTNSAAAIKNEVLQDYIHDIQLARAAVIKNILRVLLYSKILLALEPVVGEGIDTLDSMIPEEMQDFVTVRAIYEEFCEILIGGPIDQMVQAAYPVKG